MKKTEWSEKQQNEVRMRGFSLQERKKVEWSGKQEDEMEQRGKEGDRVGEI